MKYPQLSALLLGIAGMASSAGAQQGRTAEVLQPGAPVLRTLNPGERHRFAVTLQAKQVAQIVVDQRGVDVLVLVSSADGGNLTEFDSPDGTTGPENVSVVAVTGGTYPIVVTPLVQNRTVLTGQYEIRLVGVRRATARELQAGRRVELLTARGIAVMNEAVTMIDKTTAPQSRIRAQVQAAKLLRTIDEKLARRLITDAAAGMREYVRVLSGSDEDESGHQGDLMNMRREALGTLGQLDPAQALDFIRSTRLPDGWNPTPSQAKQELDMEASLANQIAATDPEGAARIAEDTLSRGNAYPGMITIARTLRSSNPALATRITRAAAAWLRGEDLLSNVEAGNLAVNLLRYTGPGGSTSAANSLLPEEEYRSLLSRSLADALAFKPEPPENSNAVGSALNVLDTLKSMTAIVEGIAPGNMPAIEEKQRQLRIIQNPNQPYYPDNADNKPIDEALRDAARAPQDTRDFRYQWIAQRVAREGDAERARSIIADNIVSSRNRLNAFSVLEIQAVQQAKDKGWLDEVIRGLAAMQVPRDRTMNIGSIANQVGNDRDRKQDVVLGFLQQARALLGPASVADDQDHMTALLQIATAFARHGSERGFGIVEPLIGQLNDLGAAAVTMNRFGVYAYEKGELVQHSDIARISKQISEALGLLALTNFDRARRDAGKIRLPEVRIDALLQIARQAFATTVVSRTNQRLNP